MTYTFLEPPLPTNISLLLSGSVSALYVIAIYFAQLIIFQGKPLTNSRNDPRVIRVRLLAASCATLASCYIVYRVVWNYIPGEDDAKTNLAVDSAYRRMGFPTHFSLTFDSLKPYLVVPFLFLGPLYGLYLSSSLPLQEQFNFKHDVVPYLLSWQGIRNLIVGPITEEITYRSCVLAMMHLAGFSRIIMIFLAPCWFGLAHIHHGYDTYHRFGRTRAALRRAVLSTLFQFLYTTVFGWLCTFMFLRAGSISVPLLAHIFCNIMGVPQLSAELRDYPERKAFIQLAYFCGIILFACTLFPWTRSENSLYWAIDSSSGF